MNLGLIIGNGKTFAGALVLVVASILNYFHALPAGMSVSVTPVEAIATGLAVVGLGAKLQAIIAVFNPAAPGGAGSSETK